jgi:hypothetical protein
MSGLNRASAQPNLKRRSRPKSDRDRIQRRRRWPQSPWRDESPDGRRFDFQHINADAHDDDGARSAARRTSRKEPAHSRSVSPSSQSQCGAIGCGLRPPNTTRSFASERRDGAKTRYIRRVDLAQRREPVTCVRAGIAWPIRVADRAGRAGLLRPDDGAREREPRECRSDYDICARRTKNAACDLLMRELERRKARSARLMPDY